MSYSAQYLRLLAATLAKLDASKADEVIEVFRAARREGRQIFICGNGGSAATANHFACDIVKGASFEREQRFRIMALSEQIPTLTAYANDVGYEHVFSEQLKNFARPGDIVIAVSGSGNSPNVVRAIEYGNAAGCLTIAFTGFEGGKIGPLAKIHLNVPDTHMGRIEDGHLILLHAIAYCLMEEPRG